MPQNVDFVMNCGSGLIFTALADCPPGVPPETRRGSPADFLAVPPSVVMLAGAGGGIC